MEIALIKSAEVPDEPELLDDAAERDDQQLDGLKALIARLQAEKEQSEQDDNALGAKDGRGYAQRASYDAFVFFERIQNEEIWVRGGWQMPEWAEEKLAEYIQERLVTSSDAFRTGWLEGLLEVWEQVKDQV